MDRLRLVAASGRPRSAYVAPVAFLLAVSLAVSFVRIELRHHTPAPGKPHIATATRTQKAAAKKPAHAFYVVRAGDTMTSIAAKTHVSVTHLMRLNPRVSPTALFIGEKIHLR